MSQTRMYAIPTAVSRTDLVAAAIKEAILSGELRPGQRLVERDIADQLQVSKTPVREALKVLSHGGLVVNDPFRPMHVVDVDRAFVVSVYELRVLIEPVAVERAVGLHSPETISAARHALDEAREAELANELARLSLANRRFHQALYAPSENALLKSVIDSLNDKVALISVVGWAGGSTWLTEHGEHEQILQQVEQRDGVKAGAMLRDHIVRFSEALLSRLEAAGLS